MNANFDDKRNQIIGKTNVNETSTRETTLNTKDFEKLKDPKGVYGINTAFIPEMQTCTWVSKITLEKPPIWCSVDLRDGNQALRNPMTLEKKLKFWEMLVSLGFKEIEIGFPAASTIEYDFTRILIEENLIPDDVVIQVLSQSREEQIEKTVMSLKGAKNAIVHLYNSTSELQRRVVFKKTQDEIIDIILKGVSKLSKLKNETDTNITLEYSPESFTGTEPDFALRICDAVIEASGASKDNKMIINLPATVEMTPPHIYANQIEYFSNNVCNRDAIILSIHPHNDMGMAIAATQLGLFAGADRVEGTLFGNGERSGNADILVIALNLYTQGMDPKLNLSNVDKVKEIYEECTGLEVHARHPYAGKEIFTAYSGSHQDAIRKSLDAMKNNEDDKKWPVPYIPINPADIGRKEGINFVVVNSQSGKGGVTYIVRENFGLEIPKEMQGEFANVVQKFCEGKNKAITNDELKDLFYKMYFKNKPSFNFSLDSLKYIDDKNMEISFKLEHKGRTYEIIKQGSNEVAALKNALKDIVDFNVEIINQHGFKDKDGEYKIASYAKITYPDTKKIVYGIGIEANRNRANIYAIFSALNNDLVDNS
ncbi:MAG: 2-isopropylmalate synthase [Bdellovibrionota bacterium]